MSKSFEVGDVVYLKSGGPAMVIECFHLSDERIASVSWISDGKAESSNFRIACLTHTKPKVGQ
jgi:uncharacterized protein YodC (DUF2158 family)